MNIFNKEDNKLVSPDVLKWLIIGLFGFIVIILIFGLGMHVGSLKAKYSYRWAESYHKNFAGPKTGFIGKWKSLPRGDLIEGHGAFGEIIELQDTGFVIKGRGDVEKIIMVTEETIIRQGMKILENGLQVGDQVVVIGSPNEDGQIEAKLIRVFGEEISFSYKRSRFHFFK